MDEKMMFAAWSCHHKNYHAYQMWDTPLRKMFKNLVTFDPQEELYTHGKQEMNRRFLEMIKREQPDYLFIWVIYDEFYMQTLASIKKLSPKTKVINFCGDDDIAFDSMTIYLFPFVDYFLATQTPYFKLYKKPVFFAAGADTDEYKPMNLPRVYDVGFSGTPKGKRAEQLTHLVKNGINVKLYGSGWSKFKELAPFSGGKPPGDRFSSTFMNQCKINPCLSTNYEGKPHLLERFFQISACKAFSLTEYCEGYLDFFKEGHDIVTFKTKEELLEKTRYYLKHEKEREKIAQRAYKKTIKNFSNELLLKKALAAIRKDKHPAQIPLRDVSEEYVYLGKEDLFSSNNKLQAKLQNVKYVCFTKEGSEALPYKEALQVYGMKYMKRPIACCNPYLHSRLIGDYLSLHTRTILRTFARKDFLNLLDISQLMVEKEYFMQNIQTFRDIYLDKKPDFISEENTVFVALPLVRVKHKSIAGYEKEIGDMLVPLFENELRRVKNQKRIFTDSYVYKLYMYALLFNPTLRRYLFRQISAHYKKATSQ